MNDPITTDELQQWKAIAEAAKIAIANEASTSQPKLSHEYCLAISRFTTAFGVTNALRLIAAAERLEVERQHTETLLHITDEKACLLFDKVAGFVAEHLRYRTALESIRDGALLPGVVARLALNQIDEST